MNSVDKYGLVTTPNGGAVWAKKVNFGANLGSVYLFVNKDAKHLLQASMRFSAPMMLR